eukprot:1179740-Prorocentrum_minimum.AAC.4
MEEVKDKAVGAVDGHEGALLPRPEVPIQMRHVHVRVLQPRVGSAVESQHRPCGARPHPPVDQPPDERGDADVREPHLGNNRGIIREQSGNNRGTIGEQSGNNRGTIGEQSGNKQGTIGEQSGNNRGTHLALPLAGEQRVLALGPGVRVEMVRRSAGGPPGHPRADVHGPADQQHEEGVHDGKRPLTNRLNELVRLLV